MTWRIATRRSGLAQAQARTVADALTQLTDRPCELVPMATTGDEHPERAIEAFDSKGLFIDRTRESVLAGDCHFVVHSYKDLPTEPMPGLAIPCVPRRVDPRDVLVTRDGQRLATLPRTRPVTIGTSSARRRSQIAKVRRDILLQPLRGNIVTRMGKVRDGDLDGVVLALAGLLRLRPGPGGPRGGAARARRGPARPGAGRARHRVPRGRRRHHRGADPAGPPRDQAVRHRRAVAADRARWRVHLADRGARPRGGWAPTARTASSCSACCPTRPGRGSSGPATRPP